MDELPDEMLLGVLCHLEPSALHSASLVSHRWHSLATEPCLFRKHVLRRDWGRLGTPECSGGAGATKNEEPQHEEPSCGTEPDPTPEVEPASMASGDEHRVGQSATKEKSAHSHPAVLPEAKVRGLDAVYCTYNGPKAAKVPILSQLAPQVQAEDWAPIYKQLHTLDDEVVYEDVILKGVCASSTDDQPDDQSIEKTLTAHGFWSSAGAPDENSGEELIYELRGLALIFAVDIKPYQARFQVGIPTYASKTVELEFGLTMDDWVSFPEYRLANVGAVQRITMAPHAICAKYLKIKLHGRCSRQPSDWLFYTVLERVMACGILVKDLRSGSGASLRRAFEPLDPTVTADSDADTTGPTGARQTHRILYESGAVIFSALNYLFRKQDWKAMAVWCKLHPSHVQERQLLIAAVQQRGTPAQQKCFLDTLHDSTLSPFCNPIP